MSANATEDAAFVDCPLCLGAITPEPLMDGRVGCDNCGNEYLVPAAFHRRVVEWWRSR